MKRWLILGFVCLMSHPAHAATYAVSVTKTNYASGESIVVNWSAPSGHSSTDWISLYSSGATNTQHGAWYYTGSNLSGTLSFTAPASAGTYEIRYLMNNGYTSAATSNRFSTVTSADTTPPTVSITSPASGATYTTVQTVTLTATASDNVGVARVEFYDGGVLKGTDTTAPYTYAWAFTSANNGTHSWTARAYDAAGNTSLSAPVSLTVNLSASSDTTPPTVSISSPTAGNSYSFTQTVSIVASAFDNVGVTKVEFYDGGVLKGTATTAPYSYPWSIAQADDGTQTWTAKAYDAAGNTATSAAVLLYVNIVPSTNWVRQFGGPNAGDVAIGRASALDPFGNVVLAATQIGTGNYGGTSVTGTSSLDLPVVAKYSASGQLLWVRMFVTTTGSQAIPTAVTTDIDGAVLIAGWFTYTVDFGTGPLTSAGGPDVFVAKYSPTGTPLWAKRFGSTSADKALALDIDVNGAIYVTGLFAGSVDFGSGAPLVSAGSSDAFVAKYDTNGNGIWAKRFGGTLVDAAASIAIDGTGNIVVGGYFQGTATFDGTSLVSAGGKDMFVVTLGTDGHVTRLTSYGGTGDDEVRGVAVDGSGNIIVAGMYSGSISMGGPTLTSAGSLDVVLAKYSSTGVHQWSKSFGSTSPDYVNAVSANAAGQIVMTGSIIDAVDFGGGRLYSNGSWNAFIACFGASGTPAWSIEVGASYDDQGLSVAISSTGEVVATGDFIQSVNFGTSNLANTGGADGYLIRFYP
ncbi:MAG: hypothetical protein DMF89_21485 [Acidobacteria bacterium]|nr:MAG: hypothetical protein DMF89_21485 [Acidobacteriota bacterium]